MSASLGAAAIRNCFCNTSYATLLDLVLSHPSCQQLAESEHIRYDSNDALSPRRSPGL